MKNKIKVGSIFVSKSSGEEYKVLSIHDLVYDLSWPDNFTSMGHSSTIEELEKHYTLKEEEWMPEVGSMVFIPAPSNTDFYYVSDWDDDEADKMRLERGLVFKSKEQAIKKCKEMLSK